jgi:hypothetical protein
MHLDIHRLESSQDGTISEISVYPDHTCQGKPIATYVGMEQPWMDNKPFRSCIPAGEYRLVRHDSAKYGQVWAFVGGTVAHQEAPNSPATRFACLIHSGNFADDVEGCLALGKGRAVEQATGRKMVTGSRTSVQELRAIAPPAAGHTAAIRWGAT